MTCVVKLLADTHTQFHVVQAVWVDGLCLSCGVTGASSALMEEINRLLDVEVELHLLEAEQDSKPPVPPPPFDCAFLLL